MPSFLRHALPHLQVLTLSSIPLLAAKPTTGWHKRAEVPATIFEWTAFGDSYAAGVGAGSIVGPGHVTDGSYPQQMNNNDPRIGDAQNRVFHDLAYSGSRTSQVIEAVKKIGNPQLVTLQIGMRWSEAQLRFLLCAYDFEGGNDAGFYDIMTACIYRFGAGISGNCDDALSSFQNQLDNAVPTAMDNTIEAIVGAAPNLEQLIVIGYTAPFNVDTTQCNDVTFAFWSVDQSPQYLTQSLRQSINDKITNLNGVIATAVARATSGANSNAGPNVVFVDFTSDWNSHRFCEDGVIEPAKNRDNSWLYTLPSLDTQDFSSDSTPLPDASTCKTTAQASGDWGALAMCDMSQALKSEPNLAVLGGLFFGGAEYGRIGHPKPIGMIF